MLFLASHLYIKDYIISILKKQRVAGQLLYTICIQPLIKAIILEKAPQLLQSNHMTAF